MTDIVTGRKLKIFLFTIVLQNEVVYSLGNPSLLPSNLQNAKLKTKDQSSKKLLRAASRRKLRCKISNKQRLTHSSDSVN